DRHVLLARCRGRIDREVGLKRRRADELDGLHGHAGAEADGGRLVPRRRVATDLDAKASTDESVIGEHRGSITRARIMAAAGREQRQSEYKNTSRAHQITSRDVGYSSAHPTRKRAAVQRIKVTRLDGSCG